MISQNENVCDPIVDDLLERIIRAGCSKCGTMIVGEMTGKLEPGCLLDWEQDALRVRCATCVESDC